MTGTIRREILIPQPREQVWRALTASAKALTTRRARRRRASLRDYLPDG